MGPGTAPAAGAPSRLGRYQIVGEIGRGGMGIVYRALDPTIGRTVAIKTILVSGRARKNWLWRAATPRSSKKDRRSRLATSG